MGRIFKINDNFSKAKIMIGYFGDNEPPVVPPTPPAKTFTQDDVDRIVQERVKRKTDEGKVMLTELEQLRGSVKMSDEQKQQLEDRITTLSKEVYTKEELAKQQLDKYEKKSKEDRELLTSERDGWKKRHDTLTIKTALLQAASESKAVSSEQMLDLLSGKAKIVEIMDSEGKPTGDFSVKLPVKAKKGDKVVELELTASDALKTMRDNVEIYGNLFVYDGKPGLGLNSSGSTGKIDPANETDEQFYARRESEKGRR